METVYRDYAPQGVQFFYLYKALIHPENFGYVRPVTLEERLMHIQEARRTLGSEIPWLCDAMDNRLKHALGNAPNPEFVIDPEGKIIARRMWSDAEALRADLERAVGPVENPTKVADLSLPVADPPKTAPAGVVERVKMPSRMRALRIEAQLESSKHPFYVKLRAEADNDLLREGAGKMYLGFHLDPLYNVHWNNLVDPVQYEFQTPEGVSISPSKGKGPDVAQESDSDPREFLLDVNRGDSTEPAHLKFRYFACDEKMCMPVTQEYAVHWEIDPDGGNPNRNRFGAGGSRMDPRRMVERLMEYDLDGDGRLEKQDLPERMQQRFDRMDADRDGFVTREEVERTMQRMRRSPGQRPGGNRRQPPNRDRSRIPNAPN